ncbi:MAG: winged helix-turn-helix domain-containing protein [Candidatus Bathyarchaeia archaeon]
MERSIGCLKHETAKVFKAETQVCFAKNAEANPKRPLCAPNSERSSQRDSKKALEFSEIEEYDGEVLQKLGEYITIMSSPIRIRMLNYCLAERSFTNIMLTLRLNPASLKHHVDLLQAGGFIEKTGKGKDTRYRTTGLGSTMLGFVGEVLSVVRAT